MVSITLTHPVIAAAAADGNICRGGDYFEVGDVTRMTGPL